MNQTSGSRELLLKELGFEREAAEFTCKVGGLGLERETSQEQDIAGWAWTDDQMRDRHRWLGYNDNREPAQANGPGMVLEYFAYWLIWGRDIIVLVLITLWGPGKDVQ